MANISKIKVNNTEYSLKDSSIPSWAKAANKPSYSTSQLTNDSNFVSDASYVHTDNNYTTTEKNKLSGIASGAEVNQNAFGKVTVGSSTIEADAKIDTLTLAAGSNVTLTPDTTNDKITIAATDTTYQSKAAASGGTAVSLVTTGEKYTWNNKTTTRVKGNAESSYRTGDVNLTPANLGAAPLASPGLTGTPTAPTAADGTNTTQIATTAFVMNAFKANDAMIFKGTIGSSGATVTTLPATHYQGWTYRVITAGTYAGKACEIGDMIICVTDGTTATDAHWTVIQTNIDGAVTGPASVTDNRVAVFNGTSGKVIKDSGYTIAKSVPSDAKFTDTTYESKAAASGGTAVSLVTTGEKYTWNNKTSNTGTVTSVAASGSGGISISGSPITTSGTISVGLNLSTAINGLGEGTSNATRDDYLVAQYAGGGTTTTSYYRRKVSNILAALNKSDVTTALGYTPPTTDTNTTYTFVGGNGSFTVTPSGGSAQTVSIGKPSTAGTADVASKLGTSNVGTSDRPIYLSSGTATQTTYRMAVTNATATASLAITENLNTGIWYVSGSSDIYSQSDGAAYVNKYSDSWIHEIYGDYRTGQLAVRGKNNGTWQSWRKILDSSNYTSYTVKKDGTGASGTWGISITGNAATATTASSASAVAWSGVSSKPTTLSGYGITDAKIANGVITLGSNTITPLTSHQTVTNKGATLSWGTATTVATIGGTNINVSLPANPNTNTTYTFANGSSGAFTVTPSGGSAQTVSIGKPATAGTADVALSARAPFNVSNGTKDIAYFGAYFTFGSRAEPSQNFSTSQSYVFGDLVIYNGEKYICIQDKSAGEWNSEYFHGYIGANSLAIGENLVASGPTSYAEGDGSIANGRYSHAEGEKTIANYTASHAEGFYTTARREFSHAEGSNTLANNIASHAEGAGTIASGIVSHAEGSGTIASGDDSHAGGIHTEASRRSQTAIGEYNAVDGYGADGSVRGNYVILVGNGTSDSARSNALALGWSGNLRLNGDVYVNCNANSSGGTSLTTALSGKQNTLTISTKTYSDFTYNTGFTYYANSSSSSNMPRATKYGRVVMLSGAFKSTVAQSSSDAVIIGKVPSGYEPYAGMRFLCQGTGSNRFLLEIATNGDMAVSRYGTTSATAIPSGVWLTISCTYISNS